MPDILTKREVTPSGDNRREAMSTFEQIMKAYGYSSLKCEVIGTHVYLSCTVAGKLHRWVVQGDLLTNVDTGPLPTLPGGTTVNE